MQTIIAWATSLVGLGIAIVVLNWLINVLTRWMLKDVFNGLELFNKDDSKEIEDSMKEGQE